METYKSMMMEAIEKIAAGYELRCARATDDGTQGTILVLDGTRIVLTIHHEFRPDRVTLNINTEHLMFTETDASNFWYYLRDRNQSNEESERFLAILDYRLKEYAAKKKQRAA